MAYDSREPPPPLNPGVRIAGGGPARYIAAAIGLVLAVVLIVTVRLLALRPDQIGTDIKAALQRVRGDSGK